jgi:hypothetical protein
MVLISSSFKYKQKKEENILLKIPHLKKKKSPKNESK